MIDLIEYFCKLSHGSKKLETGSVKSKVATKIVFFKPQVIVISENKAKNKIRIDEMQPFYDLKFGRHMATEPHFALIWHSGFHACVMFTMFLTEDKNSQGGDLSIDQEARETNQPQ